MDLAFADDQYIFDTALVVPKFQAKQRSQKHITKSAFGEPGSRQKQ
jgi:hypothetical protein